MGEAKRLHARTKLPVLIVDAHRRPIVSDLFDGVPYLLRQRPRVPYSQLINGPGVRPYIAGKSPSHWRWRAYQPTPADVVLTDRERAFAEPFRGQIMVEPNVKAIGHRNKDWGWANWQRLAAGMPEPPVQCFRPGDQLLHRGLLVETLTFRQTVAVLAVCRAYVGPEGGLHHAAAAVGTPAVVLFGGFISPQQTGYAAHKNLFTGGKPCGMRRDCEHCRVAMNAITPAMVLGNLKELLNEPNQDAIQVGVAGARGAPDQVAGEHIAADLERAGGVPG